MYGVLSDDIERGMKMPGRITYTRPSMPPMEEYIEEIKDIWEKHWITNMGDKHALFQDMLRSYLGVENIELLVNGHMALELALQALDLPEGEIITTPFTFVSTTHAIVRNGHTPVFCDIDPNDFTIDVSKIEDLITDRTVAILPVHVYGNVCDVEGLRKVADKHGLKVLYDAAHAFGESYKGRSIARFGDATCFSFHATKAFNSIEGGAVCFKDRKFSEKLNKISNFGIVNAEAVDEIGLNAKMNEFCAAMGICNLRHLDRNIERRRLITERYRKNLNGVRGLHFNIEQENVESNYTYLPVLIEDEFSCSRDELYNRLETNGINASKRFYPLTNTLKCYHGAFDESLTPVAKDVSERIIMLPLYPDLSFDEVDMICNLIL